MDPETLSLCSMSIQCCARKYLARKRCVAIILKRTEKILDPNRRKYYYYDNLTDIATWEKPLILAKLGLDAPLASTYTEDEAALMIQRQLMRRSALRNVRMLYQHTVSAEYDEGYECYYYYNPNTEHTVWVLPLFMNERFDYEYDKLPLGGTRPGDSESSDSEDSDLSIDSEVARQRRKAKRKFPRSKTQSLVDRVEDNIRLGIKELILENCNIEHRLTDRVWDLTSLEKLSLKGNMIDKVSTKLQYLIKLQVLDISHNKIDKIPKQIEDLTLLKEVRMNHNCFETFTGYIFKCSKIEFLDLSYNHFTTLPIVIGNLELLKVTKQWEVGIGVLRNLKTFKLQGNRLVSWPEQLERNSKLIDFDISYNHLVEIPSLIASNVVLQVLNLSHNMLTTLPAEIYNLPLKRLLLNNNCLEDLPPFFKAKQEIADGIISSTGKSGLAGHKMEKLLEIDLSYNRLRKLDYRVGLFQNARKFYANDNMIDEIHENFNMFSQVSDVNLARNLIGDSSMENMWGGCESISKLNLQCNNITKIYTNFEKLKSLTELNMSDNYIEDLPGQLFSDKIAMIKLDLHNNKIPRYPMSSYAMKRLTFLDLSYNCISEKIPKQLQQYMQMETLLLGNNMITELPESIGLLKNLLVLEVHNNKLTKFPDSISECKKLYSVKTKMNNIEIRPGGLINLPSLISWDMSWNRDIVGYCIDWEGKLRSFRKDYDILSIALCLKMLQKAYLSIGVGDERKDYALIHDDTYEDNDSEEVMNENASVVSDTSSASEVLGTPKPKEKKKSKRQLKEEEDVRLRSEIEEREKIEAVQQGVTKLIQWQIKLRDFFVNHTMKFSRNIDNDESDTQKDVNSLQSLTLQCVQNRNAVKYLSLYRSLNYTTARYRNPKIVLDDLSSDVPDMDIIQQLDLGERYQDGIDSFEYIAKEIGVVAAIFETEKKIERLRKAKENRKKRCKDLKASKSASNTNQDGYDDTNNSDYAPMKTARSQLGSITSRTDMSEGSGLLNLAIGKMMSAGDDDESIDPYDGLDPDGNDIEDATIHYFTVMDNPVSLERESNDKGFLVNFDEPPSILNYPFLGSSTDGLYKIAFECYYGLGRAILFRVDCLTYSIRALEKRGNLDISKLDIAQRLDDDFQDLVAETYEEVLEEQMKKQQAQKGSIAERKKNKMAAFMQASGANDLEADVDEPEKLAPGERSKKKVVKTQKMSDLENANSTDEMKGNFIVRRPLGPNIDKKVAEKCISFLYQHRRLLIIWSNMALDSASEMLRMRGWDSTNAETREDGTSEGIYHLKHHAMNLHFCRGKALKYAELYESALYEYNSLTRLCGNSFHRQASIEVIKLHLAKSDYQEAKNHLVDIIEREVPKAERVFPEPSDILSNHRDLALLLMYNDAGLDQMKLVGYGAPRQSLVYSIQNNGVLIKSVPVKESEVHSWRNNRKELDFVQQVKKLEVKKQLTEEKQQSINILHKDIRSKIDIYTVKLQNVAAEMAIIEKEKEKLLKSAEVTAAREKAELRNTLANNRKKA